MTFTTPPICHQEVSGNLVSKVGEFVRARSLGTDYQVSTDVVPLDMDEVKPDSLYVSKKRGHVITRENIQVASNLVVEILSLATVERDRTLQHDLYVKHGVQEYWLEDPDAKTVVVLLRSESRFEVAGNYGEGQILRRPTLAGLSVKQEDVFQGLRKGENCNSRFHSYASGGFPLEFKQGWTRQDQLGQLAVAIGPGVKRGVELSQVQSNSGK